MLDAKKSTIKETRLSKSNPLTDAEVVALLERVDEVVLARGKSSRTLSKKEASPENLRGHTGSFRAPMVKVGRRLLVGFSEAALKEMLR